MDPISLPSKEGPEAKISKGIVRRLTMDGWFVKQTHGNEFQSGFPDLYACHISYGARWIEVKRPNGSRLEESQQKTFQAFAEHNVGVWILIDFSDWEINKLFAPANWIFFLDALKTSNRGTKKREYKESKKQPDGPERRIQNAIKNALEARGWYCKDTHGNIYQYGFPDMYVCHAKYGARWIEVKNPSGYQFTPAQLKLFPQFHAQQVGIWVLTDPSEIENLFKPANWWTYLDAFRS